MLISPLNSLAFSPALHQLLELQLAAADSNAKLWKNVNPRPNPYSRLHYQLQLSNSLQHVQENCYCSLDNRGNQQAYC